MLALEVDGAEVVCELAEVMPEHDCPLCAQVSAMGHQRSTCARCADTRRIGDPLPLRAVALHMVTFEAVMYRRGQVLGEWWAIHLLHACLDPAG